MKRQRLLLHIGFWLTYGLYDGYLNAPISGPSYAHLSFGEQMMRAYLAELIVLSYKIPATYLVLYRLVPWYFRSRNLPAFVASLGAVTVAVTVAGKWSWFQLIYPHIYQVSNPDPTNDWARIVFRWLWNSIDVLLLLSVASAIRFFRLSVAAANRETALIRDKIESELRFLKAQSYPHFLFNTLNNLYHLARKRSDYTPDAILKLSELLRFVLYECSVSFIPISREARVVLDYIDLEKLRYDERLSVDFQIDIDREAANIAPLLLLPFVENAFKHGLSEMDGHAELRIRLSLRRDVVEFEVSNPKPAASVPDPAGIGLKNIRRQLELLYPEHTLKIEDHGDRFDVFLRFELCEN